MDTLVTIYKYYKDKKDKPRAVNAETRHILNDDYYALNMWCEGVDDLSFIYKKKEDVVHFFFCYHLRPELTITTEFEDKLKAKFSRNHGLFKEISIEKDLIELSGEALKESVNSFFLDELNEYIVNSDFVRTLNEIEDNLIDLKERQLDDLARLVKEGVLGDEELIENATILVSYLLDNPESHDTFMSTFFRMNRYKVNEALDVLKNMDVVMCDEDFGYSVKHNEIADRIEMKFEEEDIESIKQLIKEEIEND